MINSISNFNFLLQIVFFQDVVLICFAINNRNSYSNVRTYWYPEISRYCGNVPIVLAGTKVDLRGLRGYRRNRGNSELIDPSEV